MRYETEIRAYDIFDRVWISARVWETRPDAPGRSDCLLTVAVSAAGEGISEPGEWLRDALIALAETL